MTSVELQLLIKCIALLSIFLILGMFLRAKVHIFGKLLLPASVIGGFVLLILGPEVTGLISVPEEYMTTWMNLPGILIVPIFASVPFCNGMNEPKKEKGEFKRNLPKVLISCGLFSAGGGMQMAAGFGFTLVAMTIMPSLGLYRTFGYELSQGFSGGHGTAAAIGTVLEGYGLDYWETSMGVGMAFATIGLVGGMLLGILFINIALRNGRTKILDRPGQIPVSTLTGYSKDIKEQQEMGRETVDSSSIETISLHLGVILIDCGLAYFLHDRAVLYAVPGFSSIPVWFYGLILMYAINFILRYLKLDFLFDKKVKSRITGALTDFAIISAVASISVSTVKAFLIPIIILAVIGFVVTFICSFPLYRFCFGERDYPFERAIMSWGVNTGVMINGIMLLKICDPDYLSPSLNDFSMGFALMSIISIFTSPVSYSLLASGSTAANFVWQALLCLFYFAMAFIGRAFLKKTEPENFT